MESGATRSRIATAALVVVLLATFAIGQICADSIISPAERSGAGEIVGRAGYSYLSGLRTFAAAVLWNRMEPLQHSYYEDMPLDQHLFVLPTIYIVTRLDPTLLDPYYVGSWIIARNGKIQEGLDLARQGMEANPQSGLMYASYAQMLFILEHDPKAALPYARKALEPQMTWRSLEEQFEGYAVVRDILEQNGMTTEADQVQAEMDRIARAIDSAPSLVPGTGQ